MPEIAVVYHAQLGQPERPDNLKSWISERKQVIVATSALGVGIDVPNVRLVVHVCEPKTLIDYAQQTSRGGRDNQPTRCVMLLPSSSKLLNKNTCLRKQLLNYLNGESDMKMCLSVMNACGSCEIIKWQPSSKVSFERISVRIFEFKNVRCQQGMIH